MKIKGLVTSGSQKGSYFMSQEIYIHQFQEKLGFKPFEGTFNILIEKQDLENIHEIREKNAEIVKGEGGFGDVEFIKATLEDKLEGAVIFPAKTHHPKEFLEFITSENVRETLNVRDGDFVTLSVD
ncbi:MAG: riboflavin kinase [Methanobacteriales archaeon HGW-Methanobacteriales-1]|jgi:riboflavin kinase|nr:MAG: riboflavin kinase [Methanobacteriales archaeon HGW-Methanobacteriales-1]